jgi:diaminopimelate epimerase
MKKRADNRNRHFWKVEAAGNDFVFLSENPAPLKASVGELVRRICSRRLGVGADGVVFAWKEGRGPKASWHWRFFNPDGSEAEICGNAARGMAVWLVRTSRVKTRQLRWDSPIGEIRAVIEGKSSARVQWPLSQAGLLEIPEDLLEELTMGFNDRGLGGAYRISVGNPHLVLLNHDVWNEQDRLASGRKLRSHPSLGPAGANVTWVNLNSSTPQSGVSAVTFERGVEAETLACGSGAVAAFLAIESFDRENRREPSAEKTLAFPGGNLQVQRRKDGLWLSGPARIVFEGKWT